jgi:hypothetical protein
MPRNRKPRFVQLDIPELPGYISIAQWAARLNISRTRAHEYIEARRVKVWRIGANMFVVRANTKQPRPIGRRLKSETLINEPASHEHSAA